MKKVSAQFKNAFTLAEVLITLVIVGIIAALTIPSVINNMQKNELRSQFKKSVSVTSQAVQKMKADYGDLVNDSANNTQQSFRDTFMSYFSVICNTNCVDENKYKNLINNSSDGEGFFSESFITQDGSSYGFSKSSYSGYIYITVDINGPAKRPNRFGYDVFSFYIIDNNLNFCGDKIPGPGVSCDDSDDARNGLGCTQKAVFDANYFKNLPK